MAISRRQFLLGAGAAALAGGAAYEFGFWDRILFFFGVKKWLPFQETLHSFQHALKVYVHAGVTYTHLAQLYTGSEKNTKGIQSFNEKKILREGGYACIPFDLLAPYVLDIIGKRITIKEYTIDNDDLHSLGELADKYLNPNVYNNYMYNVYMIELLNNINPVTDIVRQGQVISIPEFLIKEDVKDDAEDEDSEKQEPIREEEKEEEKQPLPPIDRHSLLTYYTQYYPPINKSKETVVRAIRARDRYGAPRVRTGGRLSRHQGLDIVASVGTTLYPMAVGRVTIAGKEPNRNLWRNGNVVEITTKRGWTIKYCHLRKVFVKKGQLVGFGTPVGEVGVTGIASSNNPHVHIGARLLGQLKNPQVFLDGNANFLDVAQQKEREYVAHFAKIKQIDKRRV